MCKIIELVVKKYLNKSKISSFFAQKKEKKFILQASYKEKKSNILAMAWIV